MLPGQTGWVVLDRLRKEAEMSDVPIFVVSVLDNNREALSRGATEYLQKPLSKDALLRALRKHAPQRFGNAGDASRATLSGDGQKQ
jgi:CheY-like chemotaxis protein